MIEERGLESDRALRSVALRRGNLEDEMATFDVMRKAMGFDMNWSHHISARRHLRSSPRSSFWIADDTPRFGRSRVVGYAHSLVRDNVWQLTEFFVLPSYHGHGIGGALLEKCLQDGDAAGGNSRFILASHHPAAHSLYIRKANCFPRLPMLLMAGQAQALHTYHTRNGPIFDTSIAPDVNSIKQFGREGQPLMAEPIVADARILERFAVMDREALGYSRSPEHAHWISQMGGVEGAARLFRYAGGGSDNGKVAGYCYFGEHSSGPALAQESEDLPRMICHVMGLSRSAILPVPGRIDPYLAVPGSNTQIALWLLQCGWRIIFQYLYMSSEPPGQLERYVCHNPLHFF